MKLEDLSLSELKTLANQKFVELKSIVTQKRLDDYKTALMDSGIPRPLLGSRMREVDAIVDLIKKKQIPVSKPKLYYQELIKQMESMPAAISSWELTLQAPQPTAVETITPSQQPTTSNIPSQQTEQTPLQQDRETSRRSRQTGQESLLANAEHWRQNYDQLVTEFSNEVQQQFRTAFPLKKSDEYVPAAELPELKQAVFAKFNELVSMNILQILNESLVSLNKLDVIISSGKLKVDLDTEVYKNYLPMFFEIFNKGISEDGDLNYYKCMSTDFEKLENFIKNVKPRLDLIIQRMSQSEDNETRRVTPAHPTLWSNSTGANADTSDSSKRRKISPNDRNESPTKKTY